MLIVGLLWVPFFKLRKLLSIPSLLRVFIIKILKFVKYFFHIHWDVCIISSTAIVSHWILNHSCISRRKALWHNILSFLYHWIFVVFWEHILYQWLLTGDDFASQGNFDNVCRQVWLLQLGRGGGFAVGMGVEARDAAKQPELHRKVPNNNNKNYLIITVNSDNLETSYL